MIFALLGINNLKSIHVLIDFTRDRNSYIRNWAIFGIGNLTEVDNVEIRTALWNRVKDNDFETKSEAILGLAKRKDERIKNVILSELKNENYGTLLFEAILIIKDDDFLPCLNKNLKIAKNDNDDIKNGWVLAIEETIEQLKNT